MKLIRFGEVGNERPGIEIDGNRYDLSTFVPDYNEQFFETDGINRLKAHVEQNQASLPLIATTMRWASPVARPSKIICVGLNYKDHAQETNADIPKEPILFLKSTTALSGPFDPVIIPKDSFKTDWEVELAVVIGRKASHVKEAEALNYVAGYTLLNDLSEREFQLERGGTWDKGKGCDTFAPLGPYLVTPDEITDVHQLGLWLKVNDQTMQNGNTANLIFSIPDLIAYISRFMTLLPGDVISTGTPAGVGLGMSPQVYLKAGDVCELGIDGLGISRQYVIAYAPY
jgi:2,4-diketo-3-deoxy-L-fuconate hydrolase